MITTTNAILKLDENQKQIIFDYNECFGQPITDLDINIKDNLIDQQREFLYENNLRINSIKAVEKYYDEDELKYKYKFVEDFKLADASTSFNLIMFSIDSFNGLDKCGGDFNLEINIPIKSGNADILNILTLYIVGKPSTKYSIYDKQCKSIATNMESFMLLRTNPKLTGNIKLVVTEDYELYLDTFKVSTTSVLNKHVYRHKAIPDDGNYPYDVYKVFRTVPADEMYRVYDDSYDPHKNYYDSNLQVENIYEYGAEFNDDKLYNENMRILAPLYIGKELPDYFIIFRTDHLNNDVKFDNIKVFNELLVNAECVKIFDLRRHTSIGKYLNNYKSMTEEYLSGTCSLQFIEQDNDVSSANYRQGRNIWKGISFKKGIFVNMAETSYFANQILNGGQSVQERFNMFLLNGYSRNGILYPNILNLQFMFNDANAENLSMHNYFGLYLTENDFVTFNQIIKNVDNGGNIKMSYYDEFDKIVNIEDTKIKVLDNDMYKDHIFMCTTIHNAEYIKSLNDFNLFVNNYVVNKPYDNIVHMHSEKLENRYDSFLTMLFDNPIHYGEHFKFINFNAHTVYEVIASNDNALTQYKNCISEYVQTNIINDVSIYRVTFYTQDVNDSNKVAALHEQLYRLHKAINKFGEHIQSTSYNDTTLAVIADMTDIYFQHISYEHIINNTDKYDNIQYFNKGNTYKYCVLSDKPMEYTDKYMSFCNNGFENTGLRYSAIVKFIELSNYKEQNIYEITGDIHENIMKVPIPLINTGNGYYPITSMNLENINLAFKGYKQSSIMVKNRIPCNSVISPYNCNNSIIVFQHDAFMINDYINICSPLKSNIALMGINSIKDIDVYVGNKNAVLHQTIKNASFLNGEIIKLDGSDNRIHNYITYKLISGHISGLPINANDLFTVTSDKIYYMYNNTVNELPILTNTLKFDADSVIELAYTGSLDNYSYNTIEPEMLETNFYTDPTDTENSNLEIPLVPLVNCQWKSNGVYFDSLPLLNINTFTNYNLTGNFVDAVYTMAGNGQYILDKPSDCIEINGEKIKISDFIQYKNYRNAIKKYLACNTKISTAIGYYNPYVNSLEFIYYGIKFIFKISNSEYTNEINLSEYNNYEIFIINDYNASLKNEMYISKNEEFILIVNHVYNTSQTYTNNNVKFITNTIYDIDYNWFNANFNYGLQHISTLNNIMRIQKLNDNDITDVSNIKYVIEQDLNQYMDFSDDDVYFAIDTSNCKRHNSYDEFNMVNGKYNFITNGLNSSSMYIYDSSLNILYERYKDTVFDTRMKNTYVVKNNTAQIPVKTYNDKINEYIESFKNDIDLHIINGEKCQTFHINNDYKPLILSMQTPNKVKFNHGLFDPNFIDIFNFDINDNISEILNIDTLYANTHATNIKPVKNVYYNKIMKAGMKCKYNYFIKDEQSPMATDWDNNLYRLYNDDLTYNDTAGYILGITDKMMFGSKCIVMHEQIISIKNWDYTGNNNNATFTVTNNNVMSIPQKSLQITLNITDSFIDMLMNIPAFINNWNKIGSINNKFVYINNYINNTLLKQYDINNPVVEVYNVQKAISSNKPNDYFQKTEPINMEKEYTLINNVNTQIYNNNNKIVLVITIQNYENTLYYPVVKINKI
ncbi:MAG: hypothetical protein [Wendovervirus sonii]|uniref:Virion structural protein n=1 Tax=phage Lak_Megaphage_Sonny TaxID=3109229 RepID=A0ABZ0Z3H2_9CAUD|nr:MAG: hypothetical protein [phage Lak_Megaphage_Sonny]